jgi:hypothetical protein
MLRAELERQRLTRGFTTSWEYYGSVPDASGRAGYPLPPYTPRIKYFDSVFYGGLLSAKY